MVEISKPQRKEARRLLHTRVSITTNLLTWLTVHGNLCLALRHPQNRGASRRHVVFFVKELGEILLDHNVMTEEALKKALRVEAEEGSTDLI